MAGIGKGLWKGCTVVLGAFLIGALVYVGVIGFAVMRLLLATLHVVQVK